MRAYHDSIRRFYRTLKIALRNNAVLMVLDILVRAAEFLIEAGEEEQAAQILALVHCYPMPMHLKIKAKHNLLYLESRLPAQVFHAIKAQTDVLTLEDVVEGLLVNIDAQN